MELEDCRCIEKATKKEDFGFDTQSRENYSMLLHLNTARLCATHEEMRKVINAAEDYKPLELPDGRFDDENDYLRAAVEHLNRRLDAPGRPVGLMTVGQQLAIAEAVFHKRTMSMELKRVCVTGAIYPVSKAFSRFINMVEEMFGSKTLRSFTSHLLITHIEDVMASAGINVKDINQERINGLRKYNHGER